ncbi:MAG: tetratricopeptide repeat protein [Bryobacterales bacterium]|jgi:Flp pilus assembly protein TadD|nr:tetratricopeptide repeat protein [Bryobacterales bacterium]
MVLAKHLRRALPGRSLLPLLLLGCLLAPPSLCQRSPTSTEQANTEQANTAQAVQAAVEAFQAGHFPKAETLLRDHLTRHPRHAHAWKILGVVHASQGQHDLASQPFARACELDAKEPDACYYLARNHYLRNRFDDALTLFDRLLRSARNDWRFLNGRGLALLALGRYQEAESAFRQAIAREAGAANLDEKPAINLGSLYLRAGQPDKALDTLRPVTQAHPRAARAWFEQGKAELQLQQLEPALRSLHQAVQARPSYAEAHLLLAKIYARQGNTEQAASHRRLAGIR